MILNHRRLQLHKIKKPEAFFRNSRLLFKRLISAISVADLLLFSDSLVLDYVFMTNKAFQRYRRFSAIPKVWAILLTFLPEIDILRISALKSGSELRRCFNFFHFSFLQNLCKKVWRFFRQHQVRQKRK
jgi:hypothetical protein